MADVEDGVEDTFRRADGQAANQAPTLQESLAHRQAELRAERLRMFLRLTIPVLVFYYFLSLGHWLAPVIVGNSVALLLTVVCLVQVERREMSDWPAKLYLMLVAAILSFTCMLDGQNTAESMFMLPLMTIAAAHLMGKRAAIVMAIYAVIVNLVMWWIKDVYPLPHYYPAERIDRLNLRFALLLMFGGLGIASSKTAARQNEALKKRSQQLRVAHERAQSASSSKQTFLANMSHEIRTPLNGILGLADHMAVQDLDPQDRGSVETIRDCGRQLLGILNDVLDLSKLEANKFSLRQEAFSLAELLNRVAREHALKLQQARLKWDLEGPDRDLWLRGDPARIEHVLNILLDNARKFSDSGTVGLSCQICEASDEKVQLEFCVHDEGIGMSAAQQKRLFTQFERVHEDAQTQGLGIGLALCKGLVQCMQGSVSVESKLGEGTKVRVALALAPAHAPRRDQGGAAGYAGMRVLVIDDSKINQRVAKLHLNALEFEVDVASDGNTAIALAKARRYDVMLVDLRMPGLDGVETAREIRRGEWHDKVPMIALTADMDEAWERRCRDVGMHEYLIKPFHPHSLAATLQKAMAPAGASGQSDPIPRTVAGS